MIWQLFRFLGRNLSNFFRCFFGKFKIPKIHSEINWPLLRSLCLRTNWLPSQFMFSLSKIPRWNKKSQVQHIFLLSRFPPNIMYVNSVRCLNKSRPLGQLGYRLYKLKPISSFKQHNGLFPAIPHNEVNYFLSRIWMSKQFHEAFWKKKNIPG